MTQYLSRKERRAAEKSGIPADLTVPSATSAAPKDVESVAANEFVFAQVPIQQPLETSTQNPVVEIPSIQPLSRRALREAGGRTIAQPAVVEEPISESPTQQIQSDTSSQLVIETYTTSLTGSQDLVLEPEEQVTFTGTNLLAEPSTQSIVLDVVPEAVSLPIDITGEIVSTGSIAVIPDSTASVVTATMDGSELDRIALQDAVTGVISVVEPVSAISVISERGTVGVVPDEALRKGWWIKWLIGLAAIAMTSAAIWAIITILDLI